MPTDDSGNSSVILTISAETVQLYYSNSGVRTADAGQAVGVAVQGQLAYENIKDSTGTMCGTKNDTSLSFTSGVFTTEKSIDWAILQSVDDQTFANKLAALTDGLANGEYVVDYSNGTIYGKKATTGTTLAAATYKIQQGVMGSSSTVTPNVNLNQVKGTATSVNNGTADAGCQRVTVASDNTPFPVKIDQTTVGTTNAISLAQIGVTAVATGNGVVSAGVQRVAIASDNSSLPVTEASASTISSAVAVPTVITSGNKTVTTSGTAEALGTTLATKSIYLRAKSTNTGNVFVGDSTVDAVSNQGIILAANDSVTLNIADRLTVYVDVAVNGEGVDYVALS